MKDNLQIIMKLKHNHVVFMASIIWDIYQILGKYKAHAMDIMNISISLY